jgi:hypothetical protein
MHVQIIATALWRKARVIRAENGEIRKQLDTLRVDRALRNSNKANLRVALRNGLGFVQNAETRLTGGYRLRSDGLPCRLSRAI